MAASLGTAYLSAISCTRSTHNGGAQQDSRMQLLLMEVVKDKKVHVGQVLAKMKFADAGAMMKLGSERRRSWRNDSAVISHVTRLLTFKPV